MGARGRRVGDRSGLAVIVAARNEADRIGETVAALRGTFPAAAIWVADDASERRHRARSRWRPAPRWSAAAAPTARAPTSAAAVEAALSAEPAPRLVLLCDGDLGASAARLAPLVEAVEAGECDLAVAAFARRVGGGFGLALGFARWAIRRLCGAETTAPISGQRALRVEALRATLPFARGFGMEIGMTVDAVRAGYRAAGVRARPRAPGDRTHLAGLPPPRAPAARLRPRVSIAHEQGDGRPR